MTLRGFARRLGRRLRLVERRLEWEYVPDGWRIRDDRLKGWNVESVVETQRARWPEFVRLVNGPGPLPVRLWVADLSRPSLEANTMLMAYGYALALAARKKDRISVLDWGGGLGHYKLLGHALLRDVEIEYHCRDLPLVCQAGRELQPSATFHENDDNCFARDYELVLASGALQYTEDWKDVLRRLADASCGYLYVAGLPIVHRAASFTVVQRPYRYGYATEYVSWVFNRQEFLADVGALGMTLMREVLLGGGPHIRRAPEQCEARGFLFVRAGGELERPTRGSGPDHAAARAGP